MAGQGGVTHRATENEPPQSAGSWVAKRDRHMQLINTSIYDKETKLRSRAIYETQRKKAQQFHEHERSKINKHLQRLAPKLNQVTGSSPVSDSTRIAHNVTINDIQFRVTNGGSKLVRVFGTATSLPNLHSWLLTGRF